MTKILPTGATESGIVHSLRALEFMKRYVPDVHARIVDVGCGNGAFLAQLALNGYTNLSGVEAIEYPMPKKFPVARADASSERIPGTNASYDAATAWEVFEHLENPRHALREIHRILKPGGFLLVSMPNVFHIMSRLMFLRQGNVPRWTAANDHYNIFTRHIFQKVFLRDFELVHVAYHRPEIGKGFLHPVVSRLTFLNRFLPENAFFSHFIVYVFRKPGP